METPLRKLRLSCGKTLKTVADAVGTDPGNLSRIETGKQQASPAIAEQLSAFFGRQITEEQILYPARFIGRKPQSTAAA